MAITGIDDKREITALLTISLAGELLPPQLIYAGKTDRCHAQCEFPDTWAITHSNNHWSNEETMLRYADTVLSPYLESKRRQPNQKALVILDVFAAHRCDSFKQKLKSMNCVMVYVPAGCTGDLQPLDLAVNDEYKRLLKAAFIDFYAEQVAKESDSLAPYKLNTSVLKPVHAA